jgi:hypothetical protein
MTTRYFLGGAIAVPQKAVLTVAGTWAAGDLAWLSLNGKVLTLTVGALVTVTQVADAIVDMINGAAANGTESRSALGSAVGEYALLVASNVAGVITITGQASGRPIGTITTGETTAGDGTLVTTYTEAPAATGPNHYSNALNWSGGAVPVDSDVVVFDHQAGGSCLYGLTQDSVTPASVTVTKGFRYSIGLPEVNRDSPSYPYSEHLPTYLAYDGITVANIDASSSQMIKLDSLTKVTAFSVTGSGTTSETGMPPVALKGTHADNSLNVTAGTVGFCTESPETGVLASATVGGGTSPSLEIGSGVTTGILTVTGGTVTNRGTATTATLNQHGGSLTHHGGTITAANVYGGSFLYGGAGTLTTLTLVGGTVDASKDARAKTIANCHVYSGATLKDPQGTITFSAGIKLYCKPSEAVLDLVARKTYTLGAI